MNRRRFLAGPPALLYTHGHPGKGCSDILSNDVLFCDVAALLRPAK